MFQDVREGRRLREHVPLWGCVLIPQNEGAKSTLSRTPTTKVERLNALPHSDMHRNLPLVAELSF
jgi:hypothetical protein